MKYLFKHIKGDKTLWGLIVFMCVLSFMPIYSASSNLQYVVNNGTTIGHLVKHAIMVFGGIAILTYVPRIPYKWFGNLSMILLVVSVFLLVVTLAQGNTIGGANASRWLRLPGIPISFQTSTFASVSLLIYVSRYLYEHRDSVIDIKESALRLWLPVFLVVALIFPANFSTALLILISVTMLLVLGGYPMKYLIGLGGLAFVGISLFILTVKAFPDLMDNRVDTWMSRIESFVEDDEEESYQVRQAKIAIATGGLTGLGPGKSVQKNFLPQSSSDFIFAIVIEEYGMIGGAVVMLFYIIMLQRFMIIARKANNEFGTLLVVGLGMPIIIQALLNMMVATNLVPVTGQTLPFVSSGGTSLWMTCAALGVILSVSAATQEREASEELELLQADD